MKVASQHAERQGIGAGENVVKRLLFDGVGLKTGHVTEGDAQLAIALDETHSANAATARADEAAVPASHAPDAPALGMAERSRGGVAVKRLGQGFFAEPALGVGTRQGRGGENGA
jgi:hypothetical protein